MGLDVFHAGFRRLQIRHSRFQIFLSRTPLLIQGAGALFPLGSKGIVGLRLLQLGPEFGIIQLGKEKPRRHAGTVLGMEFHQTARNGGTQGDAVVRLQSSHGLEFLLLVRELCDVTLYVQAATALRRLSAGALGSVLGGTGDKHRNSQK